MFILLKKHAFELFIIVSKCYIFI